MRQLITIVGIFLLSMFLIKPVYAHCEVPCGIYDDELRVRQIHEHTGTIVKAMTKIQELSKEGDKNYNQIVRWINTKDKHAVDIQEIVHQYFMTQRIKPKEGDEEGKYVKELVLLHKILIHAMKSKQTLDEAHPKKIDALLHEFSESYFGEQKGSHKGSH